MSGTRIRAAVVLGLLVAAVMTLLALPAVREEANRAVRLLGDGDVDAVREYILGFGIWGPVVSGLLMVLQALAAPLPAFLVAVANGLAFGPWWGFLLTLGSATVAASLCFGIARALGRGPTEALVGAARLERTDRWFVRWGAWAVFIARLVPIVSFDAVSYVAGLTRLRFGPFVLATAAGAAPATFVYSWLGYHAPEYVGWLLAGFAVLVGVSVVIAALRWRRGRMGQRDPRREEEGR